MKEEPGDVELSLVFTNSKRQLPFTWMHKALWNTRTWERNQDDLPQSLHFTDEQTEPQGWG